MFQIVGSSFHSLCKEIDMYVVWAVNGLTLYCTVVLSLRKERTEKGMCFTSETVNGL